MVKNLSKIKMDPKSELTKPVDLECVDLQRYLKSKPSNIIESLYNHPSICLAVYRELPEIARQFVIRILFVEQPVPQAVITSWTSQLHSKEHASATSTLSELMIWRSVAIPGGLPAWVRTLVLIFISLGIINFQFFLFFIVFRN